MKVLVINMYLQWKVFVIFYHDDDCIVSFKCMTINNNKRVEINQSFHLTLRRRL